MSDVKRIWGAFPEPKQIGRLYIMRWKEAGMMHQYNVCIYLLSPNVIIDNNHSIYSAINKKAVEVFGYSKEKGCCVWKHKGKWHDDVMALVEEIELQRELKRQKRLAEIKRERDLINRHNLSILKTY